MCACARGLPPSTLDFLMYFLTKTIRKVCVYGGGELPRSSLDSLVLLHYNYMCVGSLPPLVSGFLHVFPIKTIRNVCVCVGSPLPLLDSLSFLTYNYKDYENVCGGCLHPPWVP